MPKEVNNQIAVLIVFAVALPLEALQSTAVWMKEQIEDDKQPRKRYNGTSGGVLTEVHSCRNVADFNHLALCFPSRAVGEAVSRPF